MNELIKVTQLPIIEQRLREAKEYVDETVSNALALVCTEETVQSVKATRADLNKKFSELEDQRKAVKAAVLDPYNQFEAVYRECVSDAFKRADAELKQKINDVEGEMKRRCEDGLREYFAELCEANHIDYIPFERSGISISMADAKSKTQPPKRLREQLAQFIAGVCQGMELISNMDDAEEIMAEFKQSLNATAAITTVHERHRRIAAEKECQAAIKEAKAREAEAVKKVESFAPPVEKAPDPEKEKEVRCTFKVLATRPKLRRLKDFMDMEGIKYE